MSVYPIMEQQYTYRDKSYNDIVFENRNKQYGSYVLRSIVVKNTFSALAICSGLVVVSLIFYYVDFNFFKSPPPPLILNPVEISLSDPPPIIQTLPPAVPPAKQILEAEPLAEMDVKKDNEVTEKDPKEISSEKVDSISTGTAQNGSNNNSAVSGNGSAIYKNVEEPPQYPGGTKGLKKYLSDNVKYPSVAKENGIQGTVTVLFVVNEDGSVSDIKIQKGIGGGCDQEAMRIVKEMRKWKPGKQGGQPVRVYQILPITFKLSDAN